MNAHGGREGARARVLVVDDEPMNLELLERSLRRKYEVVSAQSPEAALDILRAGPQSDDIALILSDYRMPGMNGAELLAESVKTHPDAKRIIITGYADADNVIAAINSGRIHYLIKKPWKHQELHQILEQLLHAYSLEIENRRLLIELRATNDELRAQEQLLTRNLDENQRDLLSANRELERINRDLEVMSYKDALTGLYNHRAFQERLHEELARARRYGQPLSLLFGDIDHFSEINRELGYQIGDEVLRRVADIISAMESQSRVRASDVVARYSGEEFVVLFPETTKDGALTKGERLRSAISESTFPSGRPVTLSFGLSCFPDDADSPEKLLRCAEAAQQAAKRRGRNRVHLYSAKGIPAANEEGAAAAPKNGDAVAANPDAEGAANEADEITGERGFPAPLPAFSELGRFRTYYEELDKIVGIMRRDRAASCLFVDLSRLRRIELEFGIAQHAEVYVMAGVILDEMRGDCLRENDLVCRTQDDDAYLCILSPARSAEEPNEYTLEQIAHRVEERLNNALAPEVLDLIRDHPRVSVGFARVLNNSMIRPERLVAQLVTECRESASLQRQRAAQRNKALLQEVILGDSLTPVYQPIVSLENGDIFGFEALTRGPRQTPVESPATLFSVADEVSLTFELDRACFRSCLRGAIGLEPIHRLFVNLLPLSFYDSSFIETEVSHLLDAAALTPANVVFEITERLAIENFNSFRRALARYTAMGFGVAIDDVGTRHSNLETVMALRPHFIKVSDVLTRGVARSTVKREMLQSLNKIAEAIDAVTVAEGIETPDDLVVLHDLGVRYGQGFFLSRPGPAFPRLRASVRRAILTLRQSTRAPIPSPPAEDYDEDGESRESTSPGDHIEQAVREMAHGSGEYLLTGDLSPDMQGADAEEEEEEDLRPSYGGVSPVDEIDSFDEETRPRVHESGSWSPLNAEELGIAEEESELPFIESLKRPAPPEPPEPEPTTKRESSSDFGDEPTKGGTPSKTRQI